MAEQVIVVGASGFGREALDVLQAMIDHGADIEILGVVDDSPSEENLAILESRGIPHLGGLQGLLAAADEVRYVLGIGSPLVRERLVVRLERAHRHPLTAVHPSASFGANSEPGVGAIICAGAAISGNVRFGRHVHVNPNATIGHDAVLDDFVSVNPAATISGCVLVGQRSLVGASATILQQLTIGSDCVVGAGSVVTKHVPQDSVVMGVPGRWS